jgi:tetratricopeptide (TPR) repeat protein
MAAVTWMEILFTQGVATYAAFQGSPSGDTVARPAVPPHLAARFSASAKQALELAERHAAAAPEDLDAQYQLGATLGLLALYRGTVEGRAFAAFMDGRRAVAIMKRIRDKDVNRHEAALIQGLYRYAVATLPWHKRLLATVAGLPGDREEGVRLLEAAAADSADTTLDASLVLMIVYNREARHSDATRHLRRLLARHPDNRLLRLNLASTALDAGDHTAAARITTDSYPAPGELARLPVTGERALWSYVRGAARAAVGDAGAEADLLRATREEPRDWIRARAHVELATLALRANDVSRAKTELEAATHFARRGGDDVAARRAEAVWNANRRRLREHGGPTASRSNAADAERRASDVIGSVTSAA